MTNSLQKSCSILGILLALGLIGISPFAHGSTSISEGSEPASESITWSLYYFGIFYGPNLGRSAPSDPALDTRNYLTLNSSVDKRVVVGVTAGWNWQGVPSDTPKLRDPFIKVGRSDLLPPGTLSWYGDLRVHIPVTPESRDRDL
ncbi:MAG: hypothetical protein KGQ59_12060, partial [Bdellovibrionales bacterium]|nr:hypothetical protein [Bdellovibrionales bacterium]